MKQGYIQVYTGKGKGKTTAALGLCVRAVGAGLSVYFGQFLKKDEYSELKAIVHKIPEIHVQQFGSGMGFVSSTSIQEYDRQAARDGFEEVSRVVLSGQYDVVVLDEIHVAIHKGLIPVSELLSLMDEKPQHVELILTGRYAHEDVLHKADLVTEMTERKHYYKAGVIAREGIEK